MCKRVCWGFCYEKLSQNELGGHTGDGRKSRVAGGAWKSLGTEAMDCPRVPLHLADSPSRRQVTDCEVGKRIVLL